MSQIYTGSYFIVIVCQSAAWRGATNRLKPLQPSILRHRADNLGVNESTLKGLETSTVLIIFDGAHFRVKNVPLQGGSIIK